MHRSFIILTATALSAFSVLSGCSSDDSSAPSGGGESAKSPTEPSKTGDETGSSSGSSGSAASKTGPKCEAYLTCCKELAEKAPAAAGSCDALEKQIKDADSKGASTDTYESTCAQALTGAQAGGYCK